MKIVGFNYAKVSAERTTKWQPNKKINTDIQFIDLEKDESQLIKTAEVLRVSFKFNVNYEPKNAFISLEGFVFLSLESEQAKEVLKLWSKKKEFDENLRNLLVRFLWKKCNLKAFQLEEELNIPIHLQLPQISIKSKA